MKHYVIYIEGGRTIYAGTDKAAAGRAYRWAIGEFRENPKRKRRHVIWHES